MEKFQIYVIPISALRIYCSHTNPIFEKVRFQNQSRLEMTQFEFIHPKLERETSSWNAFSHSKDAKKWYEYRNVNSKISKITR